MSWRYFMKLSGMLLITSFRNFIARYTSLSWSPYGFSGYLIILANIGHISCSNFSMNALIWVVLLISFGMHSMIVNILLNSLLLYFFDFDTVMRYIGYFRIRGKWTYSKLGFLVSKYVKPERIWGMLGYRFSN